MKYAKVIPGIFQRRPNRFIAHVLVNGEEQIVHVKNTGRCKELLVPGCKVWLSVSDNPERKTKYDLIAVEKQRRDMSPLLINMDSQIPNDATEEWLHKGVLSSQDAVIRREITYRKSRFDFYIEDGNRRIFLEVKGVTLERGGIVLFPDAPTERGVKHIEELTECTRHGYEAYILFVIQMKGIHEFRPNDAMHKAFGDTLRKAASYGVRILAVDCLVTPDSMTIDGSVQVCL